MFFFPELLTRAGHCFIVVKNQTSIFVLALMMLVQSLSIATSHAADALVDQPPTVLITSPTNDSVIVIGASIQLAITATDDGAITNLSLYSTNSLIFRTNAITTSPLTVSVGYSGLGSYSWYAEAIDNQGQTGRSATVVVHVEPPRPPRIDVQPNDRLALIGSSTALSVSASGNPPLSYQWFFEGTPLAHATNSSLLLTNLTAAMLGHYFVRVSNFIGATLSRTAAVLVTNPSSGDRPPTVLITSPANDSFFALAGPPPASARFNLTALATDDGTVTNVSLFQTNSLYRTIASNQLSIPVTIWSPGSYSWYAEAIDDRGQTGRSSVVVVHVGNPPPIFRHPGDRLVLAGSSTTLSVQAGGPLPLFYQWYFNGMPLENATNSSLFLDNVTTSMSGNYHVRVSNALVAGISRSAAVRVQPIVILVNGAAVEYLEYREFHSGSPVALSFNTSFTNGQIFFTLNGSVPSRASTPYTAPFLVPSNATVRAIVYSEDFSESAEAELIQLFVISGMVDFRNTSLFSIAADRKVYDANGRPLVGANYVAQLYYSTNSALSNLVAAPRIQTFRNVPPTDAWAGTWSGGTVSLPWTRFGQTVTLQARVWDTRFGSSFEEAAANPAPDNQYGASSPFSYDLCSGHHCPLPIENFRAFSLVTNPPPPTSGPTVDFNNTRPFATPADRKVYDTDGRPLVGTNYLAQLYYGPLGTAPASLVAAPNAPTRFRDLAHTNVLAGTWVGGTRTLTGISGGQTVILQVRVWDVRFGSTFEQAAVNPASSNQYGLSCPFLFVTRAPGDTSPERFIENFRAFSLVTNPPPGVIQTRQNGGCLQAVFLGRHNVDASEDLLNWTPLGTQTSPFVDGVFTNFFFTNLPIRFYRLRDDTNSPAPQLR